MTVIAIGRLILNTNHLLDEFADARSGSSAHYLAGYFDQGANTKVMTTRARMMLGDFDRALVC
jgi:hypothetical protein